MRTILRTEEQACDKCVKSERFSKKNRSSVYPKQMICLHQTDDAFALNR
ncbi:hypothetical protein HMPREF9446_00989 [Bacteroides fluxus YIT 12057]|uniref:Uncharacterized protein n=1 Tax=Bacteroides fluxus YIT 12057 TaxID=763034 RepID=F3PQJ5_9BACE|nr:hypothetical protein HMPREF9446_00989 [Bacteroides fluxus YIT 12057]